MAQSINAYEKYTGGDRRSFRCTFISDIYWIKESDFYFMCITLLQFRSLRQASLFQILRCPFQTACYMLRILII